MRGKVAHVATKDNHAMTGYWTLPEHEGSCQNCHKRLMRVAKIEIANVFTLRLCGDCTRALHGLIEGMLED